MLMSVIFKRQFILSSVLMASVASAPFSNVASAQPNSVDSILLFQPHEVDYNSKIGIPVGGFLLNPGISYQATYDDNIFLKEKNLTSDFISTFKPGVALQTNWARHELYMGLVATKTDYRRNSQKDSLDVGSIVSGRYDITYGTYVDGYLRKDKRNLSRGSEEDVDGAVPVKYDNWSSRIGFTRALSYIQTKLAAFHENTERVSDKTTAVAGDFLKRDKNGVEATLLYEYFPNNNLFVTMGHTNIDYNIVGSDTRIVNKSELRYGANFSYWEMYSGSVYFGHLRTNYSDQLHGVNDPFVGFNISWAPTPLTNLTFNTGRAYQEGNMSANERVAVDTVKIGLSHDFTEFVTGTVKAGYTDNSYRSLTGSKLRDNRIYTLGTDAQYKVSDNLGLKVGYDYKQKDSDVANDSYKNNRVLFSVTYMH